MCKNKKDHLQDQAASSKNLFRVSQLKAERWEENVPRMKRKTVYEKPEVMATKNSTFGERVNKEIS